eukprot:TRINITY_DN95555_c0_g1_i1.p1 TRINITY_DN95555_c0_g1~~TRINITY_DN95555_c0_g1_i1.p1  ORF type:complete len:147 (+),score=26.20 TRINITY_DN95555_c0_g1_i1:124-564(+)
MSTQRSDDLRLLASHSKELNILQHSISRKLLKQNAPVTLCFRVRLFYQRYALALAAGALEAWRSHATLSTNTVDTFGEMQQPMLQLQLLSNATSNGTFNRSSMCGLGDSLMPVDRLRVCLQQQLEALPALLTNLEWQDCKYLARRL